ncbi:hypothetical protein [Polaribacter sp. IC073]|uniref:hypothetical protein n=1 Tax=Polaribacter sp. IC073 TaxID=2508540 RepID=UPI0011BF58E6|nr:hypothetical protein [Polaribacter sp. IC073]TXD47353.1 hypothetical protein ES045_12205 [Polaribacter sp. IC073]
MPKPIYHLNLPPKEELYKNLEIYKREGRTFYFRNQWLDFNLDLHEKHLFEMVDKYNVGDLVDLSNDL